MSIDIYIFQIFLSPKKSRDGKFQTKKKSLDHLSNFNSPLPLQPPPRAGPRPGEILLFALFFLVVGSGSKLDLPLPLFVLVSVSVEIS